MSAIASFLLALLSEASTIATLSVATATAAAVNSFKSSASVTSPDVPPPDKPSPATTLDMSPVSASLVIVHVPAPSLYDNDTPDPAVNKVLT